MLKSILLLLVQTASPISDFLVKSCKRSATEMSYTPGRADGKYKDHLVGQLSKIGSYVVEVNCRGNLFISFLPVYF